MAHTGKLDHPQVEYHAVQWAMKIWSFSVMRKREMMVPTSLIVIPKSLLQKICLNHASGQILGVDNFCTSSTRLAMDL